MPSLSFQGRFADMVRLGTKPHTIRAMRARPFVRGDDLSFFTGMRTKNCVRIRPNQPCIAAGTIHINSGSKQVFLESDTCFYRAGLFDLETVMAIANADGFETVKAFFRFFERKEGFFKGQLIEWTP